MECYRISGVQHNEEATNAQMQTRVSFPYYMLETPVSKLANFVKKQVHQPITPNAVLGSVAFRNQNYP